MSYVALLTNRFDQVAHFYGELLGFPIVAEWDRANARGRRFDGGNLRVEILDNAREGKPLPLVAPDDRFHIVIEVGDIEAARRRIAVETPAPHSVSWGAHLFQLRDPDGVPVTFLQWDPPGKERP